MGSLYLYDLRNGTGIFHAKGDKVIRKVWQADASEAVSHDGALSWSGKKIALIDSAVSIQNFGHGVKKLWLIDENGQPRHIRLDW